MEICAVACRLRTRAQAIGKALFFHEARHHGHAERRAGNVRGHRQRFHIHTEARHFDFHGGTADRHEPVPHCRTFGEKEITFGKQFLQSGGPLRASAGQHPRIHAVQRGDQRHTEMAVQREHRPSECTEMRVEQIGAPAPGGVAGDEVRPAHAECERIAQSWQAQMRAPRRRVQQDGHVAEGKKPAVFHMRAEHARPDIRNACDLRMDPVFRDTKECIEAVQNLHESVWQTAAMTDSTSSSVRLGESGSETVLAPTRRATG